MLLVRPGIEINYNMLAYQLIAKQTARDGGGNFLLIYYYLHLNKTSLHCQYCVCFFLYITIYLLFYYITTSILVVVRYS